MDKQTREEIYVLKERLNFAEKKSSDFADILHAQSQTDITDLEELVVDMQYDKIIDGLEE